MGRTRVDDRITWFRGDERPGPRQTIGVLELRVDGRCRAVFAERTQVDGRCHVLLARRAWGGKDAMVEPCPRRAPEGRHDPKRLER